jgi:hypothetical protein
MYKGFMEGMPMKKKGEGEQKKDAENLQMTKGKEWKRRSD